MKRYVYSFLLALLGSVTGAFSQSMLISGGDDHGVALCNKGQIFAWGHNGGNRLGLKPPYDALEVVNKPQEVDIPAGLTFSQVTAGSGSTNIALACTGVVYAWGENKVGTAGQATGDVVSTPMPVLCGEATDHGFDLDGTSPGKYLGGVKMVGGTTSAGIALLDDGRAVIWGGNGRFQSGPTYPLFKTESHIPVYIKDDKGKPLENIIHISGGDNNILLIVGDSKDASVGVAYSMGSVNGRGVGTEQDPSTFYAAPVLMIDPLSIDGTKVRTNNEKLLRVKTTGISDKGGFAVDENTGFLYAWGGNGWNGCMGLEKQSDDFVYASKVLAGEYSQISGESYMTNVHQVIGGNGYGACVTEDNYMLYWGVHTPATNSGGIVPNSKWASTPSFIGTNLDPGPVFANYCAGEKGPNEVRVDDALAIGRGDLFGFMVNMDGDFFVWGSTKRPGTDMPQEVGTLGLGFDGKADDPSGTGYRTCLSKIELDCTPQDECPTVYMIGPRYKCPGEVDTLYCGFTPTKKSVDNYFFQWAHNGKVLNESKATDPVADRQKDKWNDWNVVVEDPGTYKVTIVYIGNNVPCTNCPDATGEIQVVDMDMPIDTVITEMNCVVDPLKPAASDQIKFQSAVNSKFYTAKDEVAFAAFSTADSKDTIGVIQTKGAGGELEYIVSGDKVLEVSEEKGVDTTYHIWLEDVTKFKTVLFPTSTPAKAEGGYQDYTDIIKLYSTAELTSFDLFGSGYTQPVTVTVTPVIYSAGRVKDGQYMFSKPFFRGKPQQVTFDGTATTKATINLGVKLPGNPARGTEYVLAMETNPKANYNLYKFNFPDAGSGVMFANPIEDKDNFGITVVGSTANGFVTGNRNRETVFANITFGKLTDYDCGRIKLTARYGCPPCKRPDDPVTIVVDGKKHANAKDTIFLCEESSAVELSVSGITSADGVFDELWFVDAVGADATALQIDKNSDASTLKTKIGWVAPKAGTTEKYYLKVRDNEKPESAACFVIDSIFVKYNEKPLAPAIADIEFCENETDKSQLTTALADAAFAPYTVNWYESADAATATATEPDLTTFKAQADPYIFVYSVTDKETGCESAKAQFQLTVNEVPEKPITQVVPLLKGSGSASVAAGATPAAGTTLIWYATQDLATPSLTAPLQDLSVAGTYYYWVRQKSDEGCEGDTATVTVVVNDAPMPVVRDTMLCLGSEIADLMTMVTPLSADYLLKWYASEADAKGTGSDNPPSFSATAAGETKFYVSQLNTKTSAESEKATFSVKVFDVKTPTPDNAAPEYCIGETAVAFAATENTQGDYYLSSGLEWFDEEITATSTGSKNAFTPLTTTPGTKDYWVRQYYTLTTKDRSVCYGEPAKITVTVNETEKPISNSNFTFNYLKTDAATGKFVDLLTKDPMGVIAAAGCELIWYSDAAGTQVLPGTPAPTYDATQSGGDRQETFYVAQRNTTTGCVSEIQKVIVNISDTPAPSGPAKNYCQDSPLVEALTAVINESVKSADKYELIWFTEEPNANPVKDATNGKTAAPVPDVTVPAGMTEIEHTYYVAQKDLESGAVSVASPITVMVYAKPILTTHDASGFCFPDKVLLNNYYEYSSAVDVQKTFSSTFYDNADAALGGPEVSESGLYHVTGQFNVPVSAEVCISAKEDINVTIDKLEDLKITGTDRTCPRTSVTLTASSTQNTPSVAYAWTSTNNDDDTGASFASNVMSGDPGSKYTFTLTATAGTCTASVTHDVVIGDGRIEGNILISEKDNADWQDVNLVASDLSSVTVYTCGGDLMLEPNMVKTKGDFVWKQSTGAISKDMGTGMITVRESGIYTVSYENECPTSVSVTVVAVPLTASATVTNAVICEEASSEINLTYQCDETPTSITWTKGAAAYPTTDAQKLAFAEAKPDDSGLYVYTITNRGCTVTNAEMPVELTVKPYIKAAPADTFIVTRGEPVDMTLGIQSPAVSDITTISWKNGANEVNQGAAYSLQAVEENASYVILLSGEGYCDSTITVQLYADAKLRLKTDLEDKVCKGDTLLFTVDTTGTGASYKMPAPVLTVIETMRGVDRDITSLFTTENGIMTLAVSPDLDVTYTVRLTYEGGKQDTVATEEVKVLQAIEIGLPDVQTVCEGTEVTIALTSVSPAGTTIEWENDPTITSGLTDESIAVVAAYNPETATNNRSTYTYKFLATFAECGSKPMEVELVVDEPIVGEVTGDDRICEGASTTLDASSYAAAEYTWTADGDESYAEYGSSVKATLDASRIFRLSMSRGTCTKDTAYRVEVTSIPEITGVDSVGLRNRRILTSASKGTPPYQFAIDSESELIIGDLAEGLTFTSHMVYVIDAVGCKNSFIFRLDPPAIAPKGIVTPEGDGVNDTWEVTNLAEVYPDAVVSIFDRYGKKLVEYKGSDPGWDGTYNGTPMPTTDYWYEIEIEEIEKTYVGHFTLIRR